MKHSLLIVDDEEDVLLSLRSMFRRSYDVTTATRAREALDLLSQREFHVVISDQRMPDISGVDFLAQVAERYPDCIRLMITGYADINSVIAAVNRGHVFRYIAKPWDPAELDAAVRQAAEQYQMLAERRRLLRELEEANQLKTAFITVASHEITTPLTIVIGMLQLALSRTGDTMLQRYLDRALSASRRLQLMLANTFKLLQQREFRRSIEREQIAVADLFAEIRHDLEPYFEQRQLTLETKIEPSTAQVRASRAHLRDVLENLLTNAIKFSSDGSRIELAALQKEGETEFLVIDPGVGIAYEDQPHVFEPLFSTWNVTHHSSGDFGFNKRGMGVGLAIVKKFVDMHGGTIDFQSTPGQGTTFRIRLPLQANRGGQG